MNEVFWVPVPGYEKHYEVNRNGEIRSLGWNTKTGYRPGCVLKPSLSRSGYPVVTLYSGDGTHKSAQVHQVVAQTFLGAPEPGVEVNHKNGDKTDSRLDNLEYCTCSENRIHSYRALGNRAPRGSTHYSAKLTEADVVEIRRLAGEGALSQAKIAARFRVGQDHVSRIVHRKVWSWLP
jgi:hypothetical protein